MEPLYSEREVEPWWKTLAKPIVVGVMTLLIPALAVLAFLGGWILIPIGAAFYWIGKSAVGYAREAGFVGTLRGLGQTTLILVLLLLGLVGVAILVLIGGSIMNFVSGR